MFCPNCSQNLPEGARFCPACGQNIEANAAVTADQPVAQPKQPAAAPAQPAQPQASGFYPTDSAVPPTPPVPAAAPAQPAGDKPKKKPNKIVAIIVAVLAFVIASQAGQCAAGSFLEDTEAQAEMTETTEADSDFETPESPELEDILEPPTSDIDFNDTYSFGGLSIPVNSSWEPDSTTDEAGDTVCYFFPVHNNEICLQQIDTGVAISDDEVQDYSQFFIDGLAESDLQLQNGTCYAIEENGKNVLEWDGSFDLDGEEYGVYGKTYFIDTEMVVVSYAYPIAEADDGYSRAVSFLERVKVA